MVYQDAFIREITESVQFPRSAKIIRRSFRTAAEEFGLTRENCPSHPTFMTVRWLRRHSANGARFFGLFEKERQIGFVAVEPSDEGPWWIEKLAVLPGHRHGGNGAKLVDYAIDYVRNCRCEKVKLGMMNEHAVLKDWYLSLGFKEVSLHTYPQLPFTVCMMERDTNTPNPKQ
jgi:diamine N-acetyltransferase